MTFKKFEQTFLQNLNIKCELFNKKYIYNYIPRQSNIMFAY